MVNEAEPSGAVWRKSSRSGGYGENCVEVAGFDRVIAVRDSKNPDGSKLIFHRRDWRTFANTVKGGTYDL